MSQEYDSCILLLASFMKEGMKFRSEHALPNPAMKPELSIVFSPSWNFTAFTHKIRNQIIFNAYNLLLDYMQFGDNNGLKAQIDKFLKEGSPDPEQPFAMLRSALESWKKSRKKETCIPLSVMIKELQDAWFFGTFKMPDDPDDAFVYVHLNQSLSYLMRDIFFRKLPESEIEKRLEYIMRESMMIFMDNSGTPPSPSAYKRALDLTNTLIRLVGLGKTNKIKKALSVGKFEMLLKKLESSDSESSYID